MKSSLDVHQKLNGLRVPTDIMLTSTPQVISAPKRFVSAVQRFDAEVTATGRVDGLRLPQDVVTVTGDDHLPPAVNYVQGIDIFGNMTVIGTVNGVKVAQLVQRALQVQHQQLVNPVFNGHVTVGGDLDVSGTINSVKLSNIKRDAIFKNVRAGLVTISGRKQFGSTLMTPKVNVNAINQIPFSSLITIKNSSLQADGVINSKVTFNSNLVTNNLNVASGNINHVNVIELNQNRISLTQPGYITHGKHFRSELRVSRDLKVHGTLSGLRHTEFVLRNQVQRVQHLRSEKRINSRVTALTQLAIGNALHLTGFVNGHNLTNLVNRRIPLNRDQLIKQPITLSGCRASQVKATRINNYNLNDYIKTIMFTSGTQTVTANCSFTGYSTANVITSKFGANNVSLAVLDSIAIKTKAPMNAILAAKHFDHGLYINRDVQVFGAINAINFDQLANDAIKKNGPQELLAANTFTYGAKINGDLNADKVNSMNLPSSVLLRSRDQVMSGNLFGTKVRLNSNAFVAGSVNNIKLSLFSDHVMKTNRVNLIKGSIQFTNHVHVQGDIKSRAINHVDLIKLVQNTLFKDFDQRVNASITINDRTRFLNAINSNYINNRSIPRLMNDLVFVNRLEPVRLTNPVNFTNQVKIVGNLNTIRTKSTNPTARVGRYGINSVKLTDLATNTVPLKSTQPIAITGNKKFADNVRLVNSGLTINGSINGINFTHDAMLTNSTTKQFVRGRRQLVDCEFDANVEVDGLVNGRRLPAMVLDTFYPTREQLVIGAKKFANYLELKSNLDVEQLNDIKQLDRQLITNQVKSNPDKIRGHVTIKLPTRTKSIDASGLIEHVNKVNFSDLVTHALLKDTRQVINNRINFNSVIVEKPMRLSGALNGVDVAQLNRSIEQQRHFWRQNDDIMKHIMTRHIRSSDQMFTALKSTKFTIDHFVKHQELPGVYGHAFERQSQNMFALGELEPNGVNSTINQIKFNTSTQAFELRRQDRHVAFARRSFFTLKGREFTVQVANFNSPDVETVLKQGSDVVAHLGKYVDHAHVLGYSSSLVLVTTVSGVQGHVNVFAVSAANGKITLKPLATLNVGPAVTKAIAFVIDGHIYVAVARSFKNICSPTDSGSLLYKFDAAKFDLVQRIPVTDSNSVVHYTLNVISESLT